MSDRRKFIKQSVLLVGGSALFCRFLSSCSSDWYEKLTVVDDLCISCGDCVIECQYNALLLDNYASYSIDATTCSLCKSCVSVCVQGAISIPGITYNITTNKCTLCGDCESICETKAITISSGASTHRSYSIDNDDCVGCGDCIVACKKEGNAIDYIVENYSVNTNRCHGCVQKCSGVCDYNAISKVNGKAYIDIEKCVKCGDCFDKCSHRAINKAYVGINTSDCTNCGACYSVCGYAAIEKSTSEENSEHVSEINHLLCTDCGDCYAVCKEYAITEITDTGSVPQIHEDLCTSCGDCLNVCTELDAIEFDGTPAFINQQNCVSCGKCEIACRYKAIVYE